MVSLLMLSSATYFNRPCDVSHFCAPIKTTFPASVVTRPSQRICLKNGEFGIAALQDAAATAFVVGGGYVMVSTFDQLTRREIVEKTLSRKMVHILSGLLFLASWPIFSTSTVARYFALIAPSINFIRLLVNGLSLTTDARLITSISREGKPEELLRGPLYYVIVLMLCTIFFWRESPVAMVTLAMMCAGDGIADIVGRRFGSTRIPYNQHKSWAGSISMFLFGFLVSIGMLYYYSVLGYLQLDWMQTCIGVALVSSLATIVESVPSKIVDDNISVPLFTMLASSLVFGL